ncbi:HEPN domain-containing protein [Nostoc sp.]|uniref:HEPN domain-containing protein n=1 Tax=Nostoc sp. TaxID=1180 RepID=UPI002FF47749
MQTIFGLWDIQVGSKLSMLISPGNFQESKTMLKDKNVADYLFRTSDQIHGHVKHEDYIKCPGTAFLNFCIDAKNTIEYCKNNFPKQSSTLNENGLSLDSNIKIQHITNSSLALLMGHFETYEKYLFAGIFERTIYLQQFNSSKFFQELDSRWKQEIVQINQNHFLGYRGENLSVGLLIADSLNGWHEPKKVNEYIQSFGFKINFFSNEDLEDLSCLWQLRHSIVHTAATITKPDAQKIAQLVQHSGRNIVFTNKFIFELVKGFHIILQESHERLQEKFIEEINNNNTDKYEDIKNFLKVVSKEPRLFDKNV